jgi:hypothetical protein
LLRLGGRSRVQEDVDDELTFHLEMRVSEHTAHRTAHLLLTRPIPAA